jgi:phosphatidylethanolamine-binding protein (PEBP) family uncharacterized protein
MEKSGNDTVIHFWYIIIGMAKTRKVQRGGQVEGLKFSGKLNVTLANTVARGQIVNQSLTIEKPLVKWPVEADTYYTLICVDPDATAKSWLHWLVINCDGSTPESGSEIVKWAPPTPPSGTHTYYFCLFSHAYKLVIDAPKQRGYFKIDEFARDNGLYKRRISSIKVSSK